MAKTITVENTESRVHCIADLKLRVQPAFTPSQGAPQPPVDALLPGVNEVHEEEWAKAEKIPMVQHYIEEGVFKVKKKSPELASMNPTQAVDTIKKTFDRGLLERWHDVETRRAVKDALEGQMKAIEIPGSGA